MGFVFASRLLGLLVKHGVSAGDLNVVSDHAFVDLALLNLQGLGLGLVLDWQVGLWSFLSGNGLVHPRFHVPVLALASQSSLGRLAPGIFVVAQSLLVCARLVRLGL